jgi:hypothetical protein
MAGERLAESCECSPHKHTAPTNFKVVFCEFLFGEFLVATRILLTAQPRCRAAANRLLDTSTLGTPTQR